MVTPFKQDLALAIILLLIGVAIAPSINANVNKPFVDLVPDLDCDGELSWRDVVPGSTIEGSFIVENVGNDNSLLDWEITDIPDWGTWTFIPSSGYDLKPEDGPVTVDVTVIVPDEQFEFSGEVMVVNMENSSDFCTIPVFLPRDKHLYGVIKNVDSNLVEITTEFCRLASSKPHTVQLTQQQTDELTKLFDEIKARLDNAKTREETIVIFKDAVISLDRLNLLPERMSIEKVQQFVTGKYQNTKTMKFLEGIPKMSQWGKDGNNFLCLIAGNSTGTHFQSIAARALELLDKIAWWFTDNGIIDKVIDLFESLLIWLVEHGFQKIAEIIFDVMVQLFGLGIWFFVFWIMYIAHREYGKISFIDSISYGLNDKPAEGWIKIIGLRGIYQFNGTFFGGLKQVETQLLNKILHIGAVGFSGIKILFNKEPYFYFGSALRTSIKEV
jgi:hypothetical protein